MGLQTADSSGCPSWESPRVLSSLSGPTVTVTRASRVAKAAATTALAVVGSPAGYQLVRHATGIARLVSAGLVRLEISVHHVEVDEPLVRMVERSRHSADGYETE